MFLVHTSSASRLTLLRYDHSRLVSLLCCHYSLVHFWWDRLSFSLFRIISLPYHYHSSPHWLCYILFAAWFVRLLFSKSLSSKYANCFNEHANSFFPFYLRLKIAEDTCSDRWT